MKKLILASSALAALASTAALAADLPIRRAPPPYVAVPVFTWTGFYVGANAGYIFGDDSTITTTGNNGPVTGPGALFNTTNNIRVNSVRLNPEGFTGGGQIGYNYQFGSFVLGLEADAAYTDYKQTGTFFGSRPAAAGFAASTFTTDLGFLGTVRGRVGYAFDRLLVYGTGGFAYGTVENSALFYTPGTGTSVLQFAGNRSKIETGYAAGGGVEYALAGFNFFGSSAVTVKAEALYYDLGRQSVLIQNTPPTLPRTSYTSQFETSGIIARAGLNFKFNSF